MSTNDVITQPPSLTFAQYETLVLLDFGLTSPQIAELLWLSDHAAFMRDYRLRKAFGVKTTAELVPAGYRTGYLPAVLS